MAILKNITLENGVLVNYHRVVSVNNITNHTSIIEVASYTNKLKRKDEKTKLENRDQMNIFINTEYLSKPHNADLNVVTAYEYLKTFDKFSGSGESIDKNKSTIICEIKFLVYKNFESAIFVCLKFQTNIFFIQSLAFFLYLLRCQKMTISALF